VLFAAPREVFIYFLGAIGFCQCIVSQMGELIGGVDQRFFLSIKVGLQRLDLRLKLIEFPFFFIEQALFEERQLPKALLSLLELDDLPPEGLDLLLELQERSAVSVPAWISWARSFL
jgi:hypothetical protein